MMLILHSPGSDHCRVTVPDDRADATSLFEYYRHLFPYSEAMHRIPRNARVLEVGFGSGYGAHFLSTRFPDILATDMSDEAVSYAQQRYPGIRFRRAAATDLPFPADSFDAVVSFQVIEHVSDDQRYVQELHRVLRPGGVLLLTTPNRRLRLLPFQRPWNPYHVREYTDMQLLRLLRPVFPEAAIAGITARQDLQQREKARVRQRPLLLMLKTAFRAFQALLPKPAAGYLEAALRRRIALPSTTPGDAAGSVTVSDFFLAQDTRACLDLFCTAHKSMLPSHKGERVP